jgi:hypothetical protein
MTEEDLRCIKELYYLWKPVYPFLARYIAETYGSRGGSVVDVGPFAGAIYAVAESGVADRFTLAPFSAELAAFFQEETSNSGYGSRIEVLSTDQSLSNIPSFQADLIVFRGAFFFPGHFDADLNAIGRVLRPGGMAFVGGGFGKHTPEAVISSMAARSRELNERLGKRDIHPDDLRTRIGGSAFPGTMTVTTEGGLWVVMRK